MFFLISLFACLTMHCIACSIVAYCSIHLFLLDLAPYRKSNQISDINLCFSPYHPKDHFLFFHSDRFECINQIAEARENFFCDFTLYIMAFLAFLYFLHKIQGPALRRISCHGRNHSQASCEYSLTIFLCCQHHSESSLLGSKFSTNLLFEASKCTSQCNNVAVRVFKMAEPDGIVAVVKHCCLLVQGRRDCREISLNTTTG